MAHLQSQTQAQRLQQRADPQLLLTNRLLQMSALELHQCTIEEIAENPALEWPEELCAACRRAGRNCADCPFNGGRPQRSVAWDPDLTPWNESASPVDPYESLSSQETLAHHLRTQLLAGVAERDHRIGHYLIDSIDADGYLRSEVEEAARDLSVAPDEVERVLKLIHSFDPTGVGARSLQECLLIQAEARSTEAGAPRLVGRILTCFWKELSAGKWQAIARGLRVGQAEVEQAVRWVRRNLSPYPGLCFRPGWEGVSQADAVPTRPDVFITLDAEGKLRLRLASETGTAPLISPEYSRLLQSMRENGGSPSSPEERHVQEFVSRAQMFLKGLQDRTGILRKVAECLLEEQEQFLRSEREEDMRPLTQALLATFVRVHESTVSRAVAEKFLQLPSGRVVPMSYFFDRAVSHRRLVANIVAGEDPADPFSDQEISDRLRRQGIIIARRTVMKYREELGILSSRQRARTRALRETS